MITLTVTVKITRKKQRSTYISVSASLAPQNSEIMNLWRGFVDLVRYIDDNKEWLDRELEFCLKH